MQIAVFGATGGTGKAFVEQALAAGHQLVALVRDPAKLAARDGLRLVQGDANDPAAVAQTIAGADVVVSTLGNFNRKPNTEMSDISRRIADAMVANGPRRLITVTTIGVGDSFKPLRSWMFKMIIRLVAKEIWADRERQEQVIRAAPLDWTLVRPGGLKDEPGTGVYVVADSGAAQPKKVAIPRADVAHFLLRACNDASFIGKTVCLWR